MTTSSRSTERTCTSSRTSSSSLSSLRSAMASRRVAGSASVIFPKRPHVVPGLLTDKGEGRQATLAASSGRQSDEGELQSQPLLSPRRSASSSDNFVLVLEDDVWFRRGAAAAIDRGWRAALRRCRYQGGPRLLYLSYADAGGTAERADVCDALFRPVRGLWFLSAYVLSRDGATALLRAMPVVGPVDTWVNYRFEELGALALSSLRSCKGMTAPPTTPTLFCRTWRGRGSSMRARVLCRPIGRAVARYSLGLPAASGKASPWLCPCWDCASGRSTAMRRRSKHMIS